MLGLRDGAVPQTISTSYSDDEQTGKNIPFLFLYIAMRGQISNNCVVKSVLRAPELTSTSFLVPKDYAVRVCKEFCLLGESYFITLLSSANDLFVCMSCTGSRGVSILFASGDGGVGDRDPNPATQQCISNDGTNKTIFLPQFPASCPLYVMPTTVSPHMSSHRSCCMSSVTTVGGTQGIPEIAAPFSGGGFSNYVSLNPLSLILCNNYIDME
jgi:hypothetical protein